MDPLFLLTSWIRSESLIPFKATFNGKMKKIYTQVKISESVSVA